MQGAAAVTEVSAALRELDSDPKVDVIIITRGGGSFEDLLPFSDEGLVRLVASATTPIVSAIGHEKDAPLLDLVADWRASTPTDAGKRVVPDLVEELTKISTLQGRSLRYLTNMISGETNSILQIKSRPIFKDPYTIITTRSEAVANLHTRSHRGMGSALALGSEDLDSLKAQLRTLSPQSTLDRGYAVVLTDKGEIVRAAAALKPGDHISIKVAEGVVAATTDAAL